MAGFNTITGDESIMFANNASFDGTQRGGKLSADKTLWLGSGTAGAKVKRGTIISGTGISITQVDTSSTETNLTFALTGGGIAVEHLTGDTGGQLNPDASNNFNILSSVVAAGTTPLVIAGSGSTLTTKIQKSQAIAATDATKIGLSNFDSAVFTVDANGFVSNSATGLAKTITGDSGGALPPSGSNWNILGRSGSKTSGSGSTLTVKSPPYADASGSGTSTLNSGSFVTGAFTLTLPASAGLADGDLFEYVSTSAAVYVIQAVGAQKIRIGNTLSSAAGTATSDGLAGTSVTLRFRAADGFFYATSTIGTFVLA